MGGGVAVINHTHLLLPTPSTTTRRHTHTHDCKRKALFTAPAGTFSLVSLVLYSAAYYLLAALTYGAFIPSGLFTVIVTMVERVGWMVVVGGGG